MLSSAGVSDVAMDIFQVPRMSTPEVESAFAESFDGSCEWLFTGGEHWAAIDRPLFRTYHRMAPVITEVVLGPHSGADIQMIAGTAHGRRTIALRTELFTYAAASVGRHLEIPTSSDEGLRFALGAQPPAPAASERADQWGTVTAMRFDRMESPDTSQD